MKGHKFKTAEEAYRWLERLRHVVSWEEAVTSQSSSFDQTTSYPVHLELPSGGVFQGVEIISLKIPGKHLLTNCEPVSGQIEQIANHAGNMSLHLDYTHPDADYSPTLGFEFQDNAWWVRFSTGTKSERIEEATSLLNRVFVEFGLDVKIRNVQEVEYPVKSGRKVALTVFGLKEGFILDAPPAAKLKREDLAANGTASPRTVKFTCDTKTPLEILRRFTRLVETNKWRVGKAWLIFRAYPNAMRSKSQTESSEFADRFIKLVNDANFPCQTANLNVLFKLRTWQDFPVLQKIALVDSDKSDAEAIIWRVGLNTEFQGDIVVTASRKDFAISAFPTSIDRAGASGYRGRFFADWKKCLKRMDSIQQ